MSRRVFTSAVLLLLVVMMCCTGGAASSQDVPSASGSSKGERYVWRDVKDEETVSLLRVPGLVEIDGDVFAVAEAQCTEAGKNVFTGIASELLVLADQKNPKELDTTAVTTQVLEECSSEEENCACRIADQAVSQGVKRVNVSQPTTVVQGSDIYMLVGKYSSEDAAGEKSGANDGGLLLVKGEVIDESGGGKRIKWKDNDDVSRASVGKLESWTGMTGGGGSGVHMNDGTLLFPVEGTKKKGEAQNDEKAVSLIIHSLKDTKSWKLSNWMSDGGCGDPSVVEWKDGKLMMMTACDDGRRRVYESGDKGDSWTEALGTLSRVWGNKHEGNVKGVGSGFITAKIEDRDVMLVTLPVYAKTESEEN
ncbi:trans-sialidase [Trypanosoma cruzi]|nr:trans-sialidase [Trypanosoma cruzi]